MNAQTEVSAAASSASRAYLKKARERRDEAGKALGEATRQQQRVEKLLTTPQPIVDKIALLERTHATLIETWAAKADGSPIPDLPHAREITKLQTELKSAEAIAAGARSAMPKMIDEITACQNDCARSLQSMHSAAHSVLLEEASIIAAELIEADRRAARLRALLVALNRYFELEAMRGRDGGRIEVPKGPLAMGDDATAGFVASWTKFASALFADENAKFDSKE